MSPMFQALAPTILDELGGKLVSEGAGDMTDFVCEQLFKHGPWRKKYSKALGCGGPPVASPPKHDVEGVPNSTRVAGGPGISGMPYLGK